MTALAGIMEDEQGLEQDELARRRHRDRFLQALASESAFADAVIAIMANGGRGEINLKFVSGGNLDEIKTVLIRRVR
jgi:hypothetical protein